MKLGEKATLNITPYVLFLPTSYRIANDSCSDYGYGAPGFPGAIPPNSTLIL